MGCCGKVQAWAAAVGPVHQTSCILAGLQGAEELQRCAMQLGRLFGIVTRTNMRGRIAAALSGRSLAAAAAEVATRLARAHSADAQHMVSMAAEDTTLATMCGCSTYAKASVCGSA